MTNYMWRPLCLDILPLGDDIIVQQPIIERFLKVISCLWVHGEEIQIFALCLGPLNYSHLSSIQWRIIAMTIIWNIIYMPQASKGDRTVGILAKRVSCCVTSKQIKHLVECTQVALPLTWGGTCMYNTCMKGACKSLFSWRKKISFESCLLAWST